MESASIRQGDPTGGADARAQSAAPAAAWTPADPAPLGLAGFALTTFVLSMFNAHLVSEAGESVVLGLALAYGGLAQLLAGMWEFRTGNTFGAVAFSSYGAFWISFWVLVTFFAPKIPAAHAGDAIGLYLWAWGIFTTYMFVASLRTTGAIALVFFLLAATFIVLGIGNSGGSTNVIKIGGYLGLATAIAAWYASFAAVMAHTFKRAVLPTFPLSGP
ncbi:MAG TPA: acetate uptake transporter [Thermoleophilaceae bacterium]